MSIRFDSIADSFVIDSDTCGNCGEPLYDTGCAAPGCTATCCMDCGIGCDIEVDNLDGACARALAEESEEDQAERIDRERAAFGLPPVSALPASPDSTPKG